MTKYFGGDKVKNLLVGNGVNMQFGGENYSNKKIIKRARNNVYTRNFPSEAYPHETILWLEKIFEKVPSILNGEYDKYSFGIREGALAHFKNRYLKWRNIKLYDIGLEYFFLINFLVCNKEGIVNPERNTSTQCIRKMLLDSIYNFGHLQNLHLKYPSGFVRYLDSFGNIFTTNYDSNLESVSKTKVHYLHGAFHILDDLYDPKSFRNSLADNQFENNNLSNPKGYEYLHSTALMAYDGEDKKYVVESSQMANEAINKFVQGYKTKKDIKQQIDGWAWIENEILKNFHSAVMLKLENEKLAFQTNNTFDELKQIEGEIQIVGLSSENDNHIFSEINENSKLNKIIYYFFNEDDRKSALTVFNNKNLILESVQDFWREFA